VQRLIADDLARADVPRFDSDVADPLMGAFGVVVPNIFNGSMAQAILREEDHVIQAFILDRANKTFGVRIHIRSVNDGLRQLRAQDTLGALPVFSIVVENPMLAASQRLARHRCRPQDVGAPRIGRMASNAQQMHVSGIVFDCDEDKRIDHFAHQADRDLDEIRPNAPRSQVRILSAPTLWQSCRVKYQSPRDLRTADFWTRILWTRILAMHPFVVT